MYKINVEVNHAYKLDIKEFLDTQGIKNVLEVKKYAAEALQLITITATSLSIIKTLYDFYKEMRKKKADIEINIIVNNITINFKDMPPQEIEAKIKEIENK